MQPQENSCRVLLGLHGNSTEGFFSKNLYCLVCRGLLVSVKTQYLTWPMVELNLFTPIDLQLLQAALMSVQHFHDF